MLATQTPDTLPEAKDVKQQIKEKLAQALKALQKRYVTSDAVVTSEDADANVLCAALEAVFIHGIKAKYVRSEGGGRGRKGARGPLPQPVFWSLLKTVTHRDVITELEKLSFIGTDVGRCRAWLRLALNHGLLECYLASLFREGSKLTAHYQPAGLLLDPEEREVLLSYLQGLASLTFSLSYKSAVLNEWTTTPLALAGLCPAAPADALEPPLNGGAPAAPASAPSSSAPERKESWDTASQSSGGSDVGEMQRGGGARASQSSGGSDTVEVQRAGPGGVGKVNGVSPGGWNALNSSSLSLDTTGSSQLSSSLSSDSLLQGQDLRCDPDASNVDQSTKRPLKEKLGDFREGGHSSQDSMREDSFVSSADPDRLSQNTAFSSSDSETPGPVGPVTDPADRPTNALPLRSEPPPASQNQASRKACFGDVVASSETGSPSAVAGPESGHTAGVQKDPEATGQKVLEGSVQEGSAQGAPEPAGNAAPHRSTSMLSRRLSSDSTSHSHSWISEDDIYKPHLEELLDSDESHASVNGFTSPPPELETPLCPPSVVHGRQIGLSNPFRGLLKLGHLERRGAVGMWRDYYCELSPFEFRLYLNAEERTCYDNCSLLRCRDARVALPEGRFELAFPGKRLYLRAATRDEAEDWVDRIVEAVNKVRPAPQLDDWEVLQPPGDFSPDEPPVLSPSSGHPSPERASSSSTESQPPPPPQELDWTRPADSEADAIKEAVLYVSTDPEARVWVPLVFSLSLEALRGFRLQDGRKVLRLHHGVDGIRDVVPDVASGGADFFKVLTFRETLRLRAESPEEARSWRALVRGALDSYLESGEDGGAQEPVVGVGVGGNIQRLVQHRLKEDGVLLTHLCTVPAERGLDLQGFKCAGCPRKIGLSLGRARLCEFSGQYYCESCHHGNTTIIPARMVHNWDLTPREVSRKALQLLVAVETEPLLNVEQLNPELVEHADPMAQAYSLRYRLRLLGDYLLTCRSGACKAVQARMDQRTYMLESSHLYSVMDLKEIAEGVYAAFLTTLVQFASNHVHHCDLCTQRGFICQICHASDIIFPFQFDSTTRCRDCKAVFHVTCKASSPSCPRCIRLQRYLERDLRD